MTIEDIIESVLRAEGGYVNDPADAGGETNWGVTKKTAQAAGYSGPMKDMPRQVAVNIYRGRYVIAPGFGLVSNLSPAIAAELVDTGVNMGPAIAAKFLQRLLNALNRNGTDYADIVADGVVGPATIAALRAYLAKRGAEGERRLLIGLNALQGARYVDLAEGRVANEKFLYGWLDRAAA